MLYMYMYMSSSKVNLCIDNIKIHSAISMLNFGVEKQWFLC